MGLGGEATDQWASHGPERAEKARLRGCRQVGPGSNKSRRRTGGGVCRSGYAARKERGMRIGPGTLRTKQTLAMEPSTRSA